MMERFSERRVALDLDFPPDVIVFLAIPTSPLIIPYRGTLGGNGAGGREEEIRNYRDKQGRDNRALVTHNPVGQSLQRTPRPLPPTRRAGNMLPNRPSGYASHPVLPLYVSISRRRTPGTLPGEEESARVRRDDGPRGRVDADDIEESTANDVARGGRRAGACGGGGSGAGADARRGRVVASDVEEPAADDAARGGRRAGAFGGGSGSCADDGGTRARNRGGRFGTGLVRWADFPGWSDACASSGISIGPFERDDEVSAESKVGGGRRGAKCCAAARRDAQRRQQPARTLIRDRRLPIEPPREVAAESRVGGGRHTPACCAAARRNARRRRQPT